MLPILVLNLAAALAQAPPTPTPPKVTSSPPLPQTVSPPIKYTTIKEDFRVYAPDSKPLNPLEVAIAHALTTSPDIRIAQAELQLAQAKLDQTKLLVAQKIAAAYGQREGAQTALKYATEQLALMEKMDKAGQISREVMLREAALAARAKADLAKAEADFTAASGNVPGAANTLTLRRVRMVDGNEVYMLGDKIELVRPATESRLLAVRLNIVPAASGNFAANLSAKFDEPVKLEKELTGPIGKVLSELFKAAKFDVGRFRIPESFDPTVTERVPQLSIGPGTQTLSAWIEELMDVTNAKLLGGNQVKVRYDLYVREYGFLLESKDLAPPKSLTVAEFAKEVRAEKAATPKK